MPSTTFRKEELLCCTNGTAITNWNAIPGKHNIIQKIKSPISRMPLTKLHAVVVPKSSSLSTQ
jgi:hypothetical protein